MRKMVWRLGFLLAAGTVAWGQAVDSRPDKDGVYSMGLGLKPATLVHGVAAEYPSDPGLAKEKRVVALRIVVGTDGTPGVINRLNVDPSPFDDAAIAAVRASQFGPGVYKGRPVPTRMMLWVPFLGGKQAPIPINAVAGEKGISMPVALNSVEAEFPKSVPANFAGGIVLIHVLVTEDGLPSDARVLVTSGDGFSESALKAVAKYRFSPAKLRGVPTPLDINVEVNFRRD
jgi:TonB family protein